MGSGGRKVGVLAVALLACPKEKQQGEAIVPAPASAAPSEAPAPPAQAEDAYAADPSLPSGFVRVAESGETACASFRIEVIPEKDGHRFLRVLDADGTSIYEQHGRRFPGAGDFGADVGAEFCGDLSGSGSREILVTERSDGAHCCYTHWVISLGSRPKQLLAWARGDAGMPIVPVKYKPGGSWQLEGRIVLDPLDPAGALTLSYATTPLVPVVLSLEAQGYVLTSMSYPEPYRAQRAELRAACVKDPDACSPATEWIDDLVLGEWDTEKTQVSDARVRAALDGESGAMRALLEAKLGSLARPVTPPRP